MHSEKPCSARKKRTQLSTTIPPLQVSSASHYPKDIEIPSTVRNNSTVTIFRFFFFEIKSQRQTAVNNTYKYANYFNTKHSQVLTALYEYPSVKHPYKNDPISHQDLLPKEFSTDYIFICTFLPRLQHQAHAYIKTILITKPIPKAEVMGKSQTQYAKSLPDAAFLPSNSPMTGNFCFVTLPHTKA